MAPSDSVQFQGFLRPDGTIGVRNHVAIIPSVFCANTVAQRIAEPFDEAFALCHPLGCSQIGVDLELASRALKGLGRNPNVGAVLIVGLGLERLTPSELVQAIAPTGKPVEKILITQERDLIPAVNTGRAVVERLLQSLESQSRVRCDIKGLTVAVACEGLDASALLAANPSIGVAMDTLVDLGGTTVFTGTEELLGAEKALAERTISLKMAADAKALLELVGSRQLCNDDVRSSRRRQRTSRACVAGGVTTVTEWSLGSLAKSGSRPIVGMLEYAEPVPCRKGVFLMDGPACDAESVTGMVAGGAQVVVLSTCHGLPAGSPLAPVVKVVGNPGIYDLMTENVDVNAGTILKGESSIQEAGQQILQMILDVASGKRTMAELSGNRELFAVWQGQ